MYRAKAFIVGIFAALAVTASAYAQSRAFMLTNSTTMEVLSIYATNVADRSYGLDILPGTLGPGESQAIEPEFTGGFCRFDVRVEYTNGIRQDIHNVNLCTAYRVTVFFRGGRPYHNVE